MGISIHVGLMAGMAFFIAAGLVPILGRPARHFGLVDNPCHRKRHTGAIPLTGGLAMFLAFAVTLFFNLDYLTPYWTLVSGMAVLLAVGLLDDLIDLNANWKLLTQVAVAALMVYAGGIEITHLGTIFGASAGNFSLGPFSGLFTIVCVVFLVNAINMSDGLDGLAGGVGMLILLMLALIGSLAGAPTALVTLCLVLSMAILGFLVYNAQSPLRRRATSFMGDAGSMMLGFAIAWLAIAVATSDQTTIYPSSIAWLLVVPCIDTLAVSCRRIGQGRSPMSADRSHMHHILQRCGLTTRSTVRIIHWLVIATGLVGLLGWFAGAPEWLLFWGATALLFVYMYILARAHRIIRWRQRVRRSTQRIPPSSLATDARH